uniref:Uncharacterized protein n=1 Tax=Avena sativa TaxID=4498 RepID=A0ACD5WB86_AVESA
MTSGPHNYKSRPRGPKTLYPSLARRLPLSCPHAIPSTSCSAASSGNRCSRSSFQPARRAPHAMKIAVEGCMHGELDKVYDTMRRLEEAEGIKIDLLICCGDFQAVRNDSDLQCVNVKPKFRTMNSFWKYYSGQAVAPYPTIFIGGNHEASNYLWELYYGGWAAPNIYFLGFAGVVKFGNIRIGGLSGIHKRHNYYTGKNAELDIHDDRQWVRSKLNARGAKPFDFVQTAPPFNPSHPDYNPPIVVHCRNPQTESFLQFLELPYLLDSSNHGGVGRNASSSQAAACPLDDNAIELPDEVEDDEDDE